MKRLFIIVAFGIISIVSTGCGDEDSTDVSTETEETIITEEILTEKIITESEINIKIGKESILSDY